MSEVQPWAIFYRNSQCLSQLQHRSRRSRCIRSILSQIVPSSDTESQDWPSKRTLAETAPELHAEVEKTIPAPDFMRADGILNMLAYFPRDACPPDPGTISQSISRALTKHGIKGPKMYLATSSVRGKTHVGSTRLHKDITAAYNLSIEGRALWTIWPSWASHRLCEFIFHKGMATREDGNPIHNQLVYLSTDDVAEFSAETGIHPFVFEQQAGQIVCIPSNCAHQVRISELTDDCR